MRAQTVHEPSKSMHKDIVLVLMPETNDFNSIIYSKSHICIEPQMIHQ